MPTSTTRPVRVLVVDRDEGFRRLLADTMAGLVVLGASDEHEALSVLRAAELDVVVTELALGHGGGLALCQRIAAIDPELPVIVTDAFGSVDTAITAMRAGAYDFVTKPAEIETLRFTLERAAGACRLRREVRELRASVGAPRL